MSRELLTGIIIAAVAVLLLGIWWYYSASYQTPIETKIQDNNGQIDGGTLYVGITDAAANMQNISAVTITIDKSYAHSVSQGWVRVSQAPQTFSLLALKDAKQVQLLGRADLAADTYDQIWFHVARVNITESGAVKAVIMPSSDFKISGIIKVNPNANAFVLIDIKADESLHKTDKGEYVFMPVVSMQTRSNATVNVDASNLITVPQGTVDSNVDAGMDVSGEVKSNFKLDAKVILQLKEGVITIKR